MLPSLFISHGSPMLALEPGASGPALKRLAAELPRPKAIVLVSAHWESPDLRVASHPSPETWHDFGGFPPALFAVQYPAPGDPALATHIAALLADNGLPARLDATTDCQVNLDDFQHAWSQVIALLQFALLVFELVVQQKIGRASCRERV